MRSAAAGLLMVTLLAIAIVVASALRHPQYSADGLVYARYAARDAGYSERDATLAARAFYEKTPLMRLPRYRALVEIDPRIAFSASRIFENRALYPWLASLLLGVAGFESLFIVSAIAYVAFGMALFWLLSGLGRAWLAAALTIIVLALPLTRWLAASDLTDMLSGVWWALALGALLRLMRGAGAGTFVTLAAASALLTLTRPTPYLIVIPALVAALLRGMWLPLLASCSGVIVFVVTDALSHAYGIGEQMRWVYAHEGHGTRLPLGSWYTHAAFTTLRYTAYQAVRTVVPVLLAAAAIYAIVRTRARDEMLVLLAAGGACLLAIPLNPVPYDIPRVALFPLLPVFCAIAQSFAAVVMNERRDSRVQTATVIGT